VQNIEHYFLEGLFWFGLIDDVTYLMFVNIRIRAGIHYRASGQAIVATISHNFKLVKSSGPQKKAAAKYGLGR
jgi:hypothetical protein